MKKSVKIPQPINFCTFSSIFTYLQHIIQNIVRKLGLAHVYSGEKWLHHYCAVQALIL